MRHRAIILAATAATVLAVGSGTANAQKVLKFGSVDHPGTPIGEAVEGMKSVIDKETGGNLVVEAHFRGSICGEQKCGEQANQGLISLWRSSTNNFGNFDTSLAIFDLPYLFKDNDTATTLSRGWLGQARYRSKSRDSSLQSRRSD